MDNDHVLPKHTKKLLKCTECEDHFPFDFVIPISLFRNSADSLSADNFACEMHSSDSEVRHYFYCTINWAELDLFQLHFILSLQLIMILNP